MWDKLTNAFRSPFEKWISRQLDLRMLLKAKWSYWFVKVKDWFDKFKNWFDKFKNWFVKFKDWVVKFKALEIYLALLIN